MLDSLTRTEFDYAEQLADAFAEVDAAESPEEYQSLSEMTLLKALVYALRSPGLSAEADDIQRMLADQWENNR
jgi:hypothetical protein